MNLFVSFLTFFKRYQGEKNMRGVKGTCTSNTWIISFNDATFLALIRAACKLSVNLQIRKKSITIFCQILRPPLSIECILHFLAKQGKFFLPLFQSFFFQRKVGSFPKKQRITVPIGLFLCAQDPFPPEAAISVRHSVHHCKT